MAGVPSRSRTGTLELLAVGAVVAALLLGVVIIVLHVVRGTPSGRFGGRDYTQDACRYVPASRSLVALRGFRPLSHGQMALESVQEVGSTPGLIYIFDASRRCATEYDLIGGP